MFDHYSTLFDLSSIRARFELKFHYSSHPWFFGDPVRFALKGSYCTSFVKQVYMYDDVTVKWNQEQANREQGGNLLAIYEALCFECLELVMGD